VPEVGAEAVNALEICWGQVPIRSSQPQQLGCGAVLEQSCRGPQAGQRLLGERCQPLGAGKVCTGGRPPSPVHEWSAGCADAPVATTATTGERTIIDTSTSWATGMRMQKTRSMTLSRGQPVPALVAVFGPNSTSGPAAVPDFRMRPVPLQDKVKAPPQDAANQSDSLPFFFFGPRFQGQRLPTSSRWLAIRAMASCNKGLQSSRMMSDHPHCQHSARQCLNQTVKHI